MPDAYALRMRTTIRLDEALLREAKQVATRSGKTLTAVLEDALRESLARRRSRPAVEPVELPTWGRGKGWVRPGVDLDDSAALLDLMEQRTE